MTLDTNRKSLKKQLIERLEALPLQQAIFPQSEPNIDKIIQQLEEINPNPQPLNFENQALLSANWQLVYASNGTVVTRRVALRNEAVWITSYLDEEIRVGRGKTGNLFLFHKK